MRRAFERWAADHVGQPDFSGFYATGGRWHYHHNFIRMCWEAWEAACEWSARQQANEEKQ
jgi:hypothetical protein